MAPPSSSQWPASSWPRTSPGSPTRAARTSTTPCTGTGPGRRPPCGPRSWSSWSTLSCQKSRTAMQAVISSVRFFCDQVSQGSIRTQVVLCNVISCLFSIMLNGQDHVLDFLIDTLPLKGCNILPYFPSTRLPGEDNEPRQIPLARRPCPATGKGVGEENRGSKPY